jgi:chemotaxis receptor (MCP) glutamine deamidase CheD
MPAARAVSAPPAAPPPRDGEPHSSRGPSAVSIQSGGVYAAAGPGLVRTVLGSCVAACLWDPTAGVGGMNHFMLPGGNDDEMPARFGVHAMELLVNELMRLGADRRSLRAKAFGGARVLASTSRPGVAEANAAFVQEFLAREGIPLVASKFGGERPYEVRFEPCTGRAFVRQLARSGDAVERAEQHYLARLREQARRPEPGATVLF